MTLLVQNSNFFIGRFKEFKRNLDSRNPFRCQAGNLEKSNEFLEDYYKINGSIDIFWKSQELFRLVFV